MKKLLAILSVFVIITSCGNNHEENKTKDFPKKTIVNNANKSVNNVYGRDIQSKKIGDIRRLPGLLESEAKVEVNFTGIVKEVCQSSGCWMDIDLGNGEVVHVTFKDEAFVVPKDLAGKPVVIEGVGTKDMISVEMQKKAAIAEGKSQKEIDAITTPITEYYYEATGVLVK